MRVPVAIDPLRFGGEAYDVEPAGAGAKIELQATAGGLYMKLHLAATVVGPCYRCLEPARTRVTVNASEYHEYGRRPARATSSSASTCTATSSTSMRWARDALVLALPGKILCRPDCAGLCPRCGVRLEPGVEHDCAPVEPDSRWDALRQLLE